VILDLFENRLKNRDPTAVKLCTVGNYRKCSESPIPPLQRMLCFSTRFALCCEPTCGNAEKSPNSRSPQCRLPTVRHDKLAPAADSHFPPLFTNAALCTKVGYRLAPEHPFPAGLDDITAVAREILANSDRVVFAGESAGATLLLSAIHRMRSAGVPTPVAAALMSPATDQGCIGDSFETARDPTLTQERVAQVPSIYAPGQDLSNPDISPIFGTFDVNFPPLFVTTGTCDLFLCQSVRLAQVMRDANATIDLRVWEGMWHVFEFYPDLPEAKASIAEISEFLKAHL
jgi:hypothetical protein